MQASRLLLLALTLRFLSHGHAFWWGRPTPASTTTTTTATTTTRPPLIGDACGSPSVDAGSRAPGGGEIAKRSRLLRWLPRWVPNLFTPFRTPSSVVSHPEIQWLYNDSDEYKISGEHGTLLAFGDFNGDRHTDMVYVLDTLAVDKRLGISIRTWNQKLESFDSKEYDVVYLPLAVQSVVGAFAADFDMDGFLDIVVLGSARQSGAPPFELHVLRQIPGRRAFEFGPGGALDSTVHPLIVDLNSDGYPDLIGQVSDGQRVVWLNRGGKRLSAPYALESLTVADFMKLPVKMDTKLPRFSDPHSSAVVDVDGDCVPDLLMDVTTRDGRRFLEVWLSERLSVEGDPGEPHEKAASHFSFVRHPEYDLELPKGSHQVTFMDVDSDGAIDVVVPVCSGFDSTKGRCLEGEKIYTFRGLQPPLCSDLALMSMSQCRRPAHLCEKVDFSWDNVTTANVSPLTCDSSDTGGRRHFSDGGPRFPITLRTGDFDLDGQVDLVTTTYGADDTPQVLLLRNMAGEASSSDYEPMPFFRPKHYLTIPGSQHLEVAAPLDFGDTGRFHVVALGRPAAHFWSSVSSSATTFAFLQSGNQDALYIKATGLTGTCPESDPVKTGEKRAKKKGMMCGSVERGATMKMSGTDLNGERYARLIPQLSQSAYAPLHPPSVVMGLGHVNNYVDYFHYGISRYEPLRHSDEETDPPRIHQNDSRVRALTALPCKIYRGSWRQWISLIPDSALFVNPYPRNDPSKWRLELSINASKYFWRVLTATAITLVCIAVVICVLNQQEKVEDAKVEQGFKRHFIAAG